jgi:hypothetical protein
LALKMADEETNGEVSENGETEPETNEVNIFKFENNAWISVGIGQANIVEDTYLEIRTQNNGIFMLLFKAEFIGFFLSWSTQSSTCST